MVLLHFSLLAILYIVEVIVKPNSIGGRHSSADPSASTILRPGFESQSHHLCFAFFNSELARNVKMTKITQKEAGIGPFEITTKLHRNESAADVTASVANLKKPLRA